MQHASNRGVTRRRWLALGVAGAGALSLRRTGWADDRPKRPALRGKVYTTAILDTGVEGAARVTSVLAIDPATGGRTTVLDDCRVRPRVSPDGRTLAFARGDALWTRSVAGGDEPRRILDLEGDTAAGPPVWSPDGARIIVSLGRKEKENGPWVHLTVRVNADGTGRVEPPVPAADGVHDWSAAGWLLTASSRKAEIGWQLYVMRPDGTEVRQITEGGNPFYPRFSPDGRLVLYADGTTEARRGIWTVDLAGRNRRKVCATGKAVASACWSPGGTAIAVAFRHLNPAPGVGEQDLIEVMDLDGAQLALLPLPERSGSDMPDWR